MSLRIVGLTSSPYSLKLLAVLRYRRLPHRFVSDLPHLSGARYDVRPVMLPILVDDDGARVDSTPILLDLDQRHPARRLIPDDPDLAFAVRLIEDFADEWLTKAMFHYRWNFPEGARFASHWIANELYPGDAERARAFAIGFGERQRSRCDLVGCSAGNAPGIEAAFIAMVDALERHLGKSEFLFGGRPSLADFGLYGQLSQLAADPVSRAILIERAPTLFDWIGRVADLSGLEGDWAPGSLDCEGLQRLIDLIAAVYIPFLHANARALAETAPQLVIDVLGHRHAQPPFRYQAKCLGELQALARTLLPDLNRMREPALQLLG